MRINQKYYVLMIRYHCQGDACEAIVNLDTTWDQIVTEAYDVYRSKTRSVMFVHECWEGCTESRFGTVEDITAEIMNEVYIKAKTREEEYA
jgi:hypothetical protein